MHSWTLEHGGRAIELQVTPRGFLEEPDLVLVVDDVAVAEARHSWGRHRIEAAQVLLDVFVGPRGVKRAMLVLEDDRLDLYPPAGTRLARLDAWGRRHPTTWALRHALGGAGQAAVVLIGFSFLLRFLPGLPWPDIAFPDVGAPDLPSIPWPSIPWPDVHLPDWTLPGWLGWLLRNKAWIIPLVIGVALTLGELQRRRARRERGEAGDDEQAGDAPDRSG